MEARAKRLMAELKLDGVPLGHKPLIEGYRLEPARLASLTGWRVEQSRVEHLEDRLTQRTYRLRHVTTGKICDVVVVVALQRAQDALLGLLLPYGRASMPLNVWATVAGQAGHPGGDYTILHVSPKGPWDGARVELGVANVAVRLDPHDDPAFPSQAVAMELAARLGRQQAASSAPRTLLESKLRPSVHVRPARSTVPPRERCDLLLRVSDPQRQEVELRLRAEGGAVNRVDESKPGALDAYYFRAGRRPGRALVEVIAINEINLLARASTLITVGP